MTEDEKPLGFSYEELMGVPAKKKRSAAKKPPKIPDEKPPDTVDVEKQDAIVEQGGVSGEKHADSPDEKKQDLNDEPPVISVETQQPRSSDRKVSASDLVLSRYRDPWTPWSETHIQKAKWVAGYFERLGRQIHERGFHYWLVSLGDVVKPDGTPYTNTEKDWNILLQWVKWAKYLQIGDWTNLIDRKHPDPIDHLELFAEPGSLHDQWDSPDKLVDTKLKGLVDSGELGDVLCVYGNRQNLGIVRTNENALWSLGVHDLSVILYLLDEEPSEAVAHGNAFLTPGVEDVVFCYLRFPSGKIAHMHLSWPDPHKMRRITVVGLEKMVVFDDMELERKITVYEKAPWKRTASYGEWQTRSGDIYSPKIATDEPLKLECQEFLRLIAGDGDRRKVAEDGARVVRALDRLTESLRG